MQSVNIGQGIEKALSVEAAGQKYYMKYAAGTLHPIGRRMFESFAKNCCANHDRLGRLYASYYKNEYDTYKTRPLVNPGCFELDRLTGSLEGTEAVLNALTHAINAEKEVSDHYNKLAVAAEDKSLKRFYMDISEKKMRHAGIMLTQSVYIQGTGRYTEYK
jgi:hypothetical protein